MKIISLYLITNKNGTRIEKELTDGLKMMKIIVTILKCNAMKIMNLAIIQNILFHTDIITWIF